MVIKKHKKQHSLRSPALARIADACLKRAGELTISQDISTDLGTASTLRELSEIFRQEAKVERKLR